MHKAIAAALADKATQDRLLAADIEPEGSSPEALKAFVVAEIAKWADIVKKAGIQPE